jgi:hypothetical protein
MTFTNKKSPGERGISLPGNWQTEHAPLKPVVAQLKTAMCARNVKGPVTPPVYRPQPVPKVLQTKSSVNGSEAKKIVQPKVFSPQRKSVTSRLGVSVQCAMRPVQPPLIKPSRESLIQAAKDLSLLAQTVKDALDESPRGVDTRVLSRALDHAWDLGRAAQEHIRWNEDLNPRLPQVYSELLALFRNHERAVKAFNESEDGLKELIEQSNQQSFANNPLIRGLKFHG